MANKKTLYLHGATHQPHRLDFWLKRNQKAAKPQYRIVLQEVQRDFAGRIVVVALLTVDLDEKLNPTKMQRQPLPLQLPRLTQPFLTKLHEIDYWLRTPG